MDAQIGKVCQASYLYRVRSHLTLTETRQIVQSLVASRLDYFYKIYQSVNSQGLYSAFKMWPQE